MAKRKGKEAAVSTHRIQRPKRAAAAYPAPPSNEQDRKCLLEQKRLAAVAVLRDYLALIDVSRYKC